MNWAKIKLNNETHELIKSKYTFGRDEGIKLLTLIILTNNIKIILI